MGFQSNLSLSLSLSSDSDGTGNTRFTPCQFPLALDAIACIYKMEINVWLLALVASCQRAGWVGQSLSLLE